LERRFGADQVFKSGVTIPPGSDYAAILRRQAAECQVMLALIGKGWAGDNPTTGLRLLDLRQDRPQGPVLGQSRLPVTGESASPDGTYLAVSDNYSARVWGVGSRRLVLTVQAAPWVRRSAGYRKLAPTATR
jgi:hypothetical protein